MSKSFLSYLGGKSLLAPKILPLVPAHTCYAEVFAGAAWMLFKKPPSKVEVINDINSDLITLYRVIQNHLEEFCRQFKYQLIARDEYKRHVDENPETLTDIQRAARFYYLLRTTYGSKLAFDSFGVSAIKPPRINLVRLEEELSEAHLRLNRVWVENMSYERFIPRFDKPETFFYIDPPYYNCEDYYGEGIFSKDDFVTLAALLKPLQGKFILSLNDLPEVREIFKGYRFASMETKYTISGKSQKVKEVLILNYDPSKTAKFAPLHQ
ncbi:MAG: DNA adenine methylase [Candidatus Kapabacteria bacterium]|nr:DNA adenine methylase [Candidatus Kapabacteria bacterium]